MFGSLFKNFRTPLVLIVTLVMFIYGSIAGNNYQDTLSSYKENVTGLTMMENDVDTALPQTAVYDIIYDHLTGSLPEGKTVKKAIVIGYDGCRLDTFTLFDDAHESAINTLLDDGGEAYVAYCGGANYHTLNTQFTSTAPGWCTMLTGEWATVHGVINNGIPKSNKHLTLLTTGVQDGVIGSSAFYVSWDGHFVDSDGTYINELQYVKDNGLNVTFLDAGDDDGTRANVLADLAKEDCSDFIFSIFEYTDHTGHDTGFSINNPDYVQAFYDAEQTGCEIISAIKSRPTYETEDWLILITSDHGGYNTGHGMCTMQERMIFIVTNKAPVLPDGGFGSMC
ncbi:MAG: alkaline phosphatase family protein [Clostridia bacterium]|nr:alkaline phosphatase family protein [Clostridia bacterium]